MLEQEPIRPRHYSQSSLQFSSYLRSNMSSNIMEQELSYRQQIAHQLRTQYVEGIHRPKYYTVTSKSRLRVNQGHWKRNQWTDHTRLTISRFIGRWILSWPWNVGQRSLKVTEISAIRKFGCGFLFAFYSNYGRICSRLWDIQYQRMAWPWKQGHWKWRRSIDHIRLSIGRPL